jgi:hypothetical protein
MGLVVVRMAVTFAGTAGGGSDLFNQAYAYRHESGEAYAPDGAPDGLKVGYRRRAILVPGETGR